jgi:hypothetical protein
VKLRCAPRLFYFQFCSTHAQKKFRQRETKPSIMSLYLARFSAIYFWNLISRKNLAAWQNEGG